MKLAISRHLLMRIKYAFPRGNTVYWQRKVPRDLADRYPTSATLKLNLHTQDPRVIVSKVGKLNKQHEALWEAMRKDPSLTSSSAIEEAKKLLKEHGLEAGGRGADSAALSYFLSHIEEKRTSWADHQADPEEAYREAVPAEFLNKAEVKALDILNSADKFLLSDALEVYLEEHSKRGKPGFERVEIYARRVWSQLLPLIGDKEFTEVTRNDAKVFRDQLLAGMKTASVRRTLNVVRAVFTKAIAEKSLTIANVFRQIAIVGLGEDSDTRDTFTPEELVSIRLQCRAKDDDVRWLVALQLETGARIAEVAGLAVGDLHLLDEDEVPYMVIRPHPWRTLKTATSAREVPLVGVALWAAHRIVSSAKKGQLHAFPRYIRDGICKAGSAGATINKWLAVQGIEKTSHGFRHTMRDRLRNSGATRDIQDAVGGWGQNQIQDNYGKGYALQMMRDGLLNTLPTTKP